MDEIRRMLHDFQVSISHVPHAANKVADRIAKFNLRALNFYFWLSDGPRGS